MKVKIEPFEVLHSPIKKIPPFDSDAVLIQPNLIQLKQIKCAGQLFSAQLLDKLIQKTL